MFSFSKVQSIGQTQDRSIHYLPKQQVIKRINEVGFFRQFNLHRNIMRYARWQGGLVLYAYFPFYLTPTTVSSLVVCKIDFDV